MWPMRKILPLSAPWPRRERDPEAVAQREHELAGVDALGRADRGHDGGARRRPGRRARGPSPSTPSRQARPRRTCRSKAASSPSSSSSPSATSSATTSEVAGVNGVSTVGVRLPRRDPVEVEARRRVGARRPSAASETATVASPGGVISAFCEPPRRRRRSPTRRSRAGRRRGSRSRRRRRARPRSFAAAASAWTSATTPVEVSHCVRKTALRVAELGEPRREVVGRRGLAPLVASCCTSAP